MMAFVNTRRANQQLAFVIASLAKSGVKLGLVEPASEHLKNKIQRFFARFAHSE
jgi:hypothetical protein